MHTYLGFGEVDIQVWPAQNTVKSKYDKLQWSIFLCAGAPDESQGIVLWFVVMWVIRFHVESTANDG